MAADKTGNGTASRPDPAGTGAKVFVIRDCALVVVATGRKARILQEFRNHLRDVVPGSIYHHFWGGLLQPRFGEREYNNDFANWVRHGIHDAVLAERLAALDPTHFADMEHLRAEILELIDTRLDEQEHLSWAHATEAFEFVHSQVVVFDTNRRLASPADLATSIPGLSRSSIFYHFIEARRRTPDARDDFSDWLDNFGEAWRPLQQVLAGIDPYFGNLRDLRDRLTAAVTSGGSRRAP